MAPRPSKEHRKQRRAERLTLARPLDESDTGINPDRLRKILDYDPKTGIFRRKIAGGGVKEGTVIGTPIEGYLTIRVGGHRYKAHQLAFLWMTGECPPEIDHKNLNRSDNRWENLRPASAQQNAWNRPAQIHKRLPKGVYERRGKYRAGIGINGHLRWLGTFATVEEAAAAYSKKAHEVHGEFARTE